MSVNRPSIGDIYGVKTNKGIGLIQIVKFGEDPTCLDLIRVLDGFVTLEDVSDIGQIIQKKERFFLHFPIVAAGPRKLSKMFIPLGSYSLPPRLIIPTCFRNESRTKTGNIEWAKVTEDCKWEEVKRLDESFLELSPWGIWSLPDLVERLENDWKLSDWR